MICAEKKGSHWVPLLIMAVLVLCCTALFYAVPMAETESEISPPMPWFSLEEGVLNFDASKYTGGSQLTVPSEIDGKSVTVIGEGCFQNCENLTEISLPDTLEAIGEDAFRGCTALRGVRIPDQVLFIGKHAFSGCSNLEAVCISNNLQHFGTDALDGCSRLHYIYFLGNFPEWTGLYREFIDPTVVISCDDGKFYQSGDPA